MARIILVLLGSLGLGVLLALPGIPWPLRPGWIGAAVLVVAAVAARLHWARPTTIDAPTPREIGAWHAVAGWGVVCGQLSASLLRGVDLHLGSGNTLALDNWTIGAGALIAWLIIRPRDRTRDERDREMANLGVRTGYWTTVAVLAAMSVGLGFAPADIQARLTPFVVGNVLVVVLLLGALAYATAQLIGYWAVGRPDADG